MLFADIYRHGHSATTRRRRKATLDATRISLVAVGHAGLDVRGTRANFLNGAGFTY